MDAEFAMFDFNYNNEDSLSITDFSSFDCCNNESISSSSESEPEPPKTTRTHKTLFKVQAESCSETGLIQRTKQSFKCKECNKEYKTKENYLLHYSNKHLKQKPYKCRFCSMRYSHRNGRRYHEKKQHDDSDKASLQLTHLCQLIKV